MRTSLNFVLLQLLPDFVSGSRLEFMFISVNVNVKSCLINLHDSQLLVLLPCLIKITYVKILSVKIFTCLFSVRNIISLRHHKQICLMRLRFERYFSHHWAT